MLLTRAARHRLQLVARLRLLGDVNRKPRLAAARKLQEDGLKLKNNLNFLYYLDVGFVHCSCRVQKQRWPPCLLLTLAR